MIKWIGRLALVSALWWLFGGMVKKEWMDFKHTPADKAVEELGRQMVADVIDDVNKSKKPVRSDEELIAAYKAEKARIEQVQNAVNGSDPAPAVSTAPAPTPTTPQETANLENFSVDQVGNNTWKAQTDGRLAQMHTRVMVKKGDKVELLAKGRVCGWGVRCNGPNGADGLAKFESVRPAEFPTGEAQYEALIARIGNGPWFQVGEEKTIIAEMDGEIILGTNTRGPEQHRVTGGFTIALRVTRPIN